MKRDRLARTMPADRAVIACGDVQADPPAPTKGSLLTPAEAAAFLKKSLPAFYAWRRRHHISSAVVGRGLRFRVEDLTSRPAVPVSQLPLEHFRELARQHGRRPH